MSHEKKQMIGYACAYTPVPLIDAAGYSPYRILPLGDSPDRAGEMLHDNLCPHVKRVLDRALDNDLPELAGVVFVNCCDAMRRLADAWRKARPEHKVTLLDLPATDEEASILYFSEEINSLAGTLSEWRGTQVSPETIEKSIERFNGIADSLNTLKERLSRGVLEGGAAAMQDLFNTAATTASGDALSVLEKAVGEPESVSKNHATPVFLFGNVLANAEAFQLFEKSGAAIVGDDLCTGSRAFCRIEALEGEDVMMRLARGLLRRPKCARTFDPSLPGNLGDEILARAQACNAKGVICHTMKFCDPYNARLPRVRETLREAGIPMLALEGDCTMRSMGQQRTRIEAFIEMLG